jgi:hypothetical protein
MDNLMRLALEKQPIDVGQWLIDRVRLDLSASKAGYSKVVSFRPKTKQIQVPSSMPQDSNETFDDLNYG